MTTKTAEAEVQRLVSDELDRQEQARVERIRQTVLERKALEDAERARQARIEQLRADIAEQLDPAPVDAAEAELAQALDRYVAVCVAHDRRYSALWAEVSELASSGRLPADMGATSRWISVGGRDWWKSRIHTRLIRTAQAALQKHQPRDYVDLSRPSQD